MIAVEDFVYCDFYDDVHADEPDPYGESPVRERPADMTEAGWSWTTRPPYGNARYWFFTCPGPHYKLWKGKELR
jgi:hypothetical protein